MKRQIIVVLTIILSSGCIHRPENIQIRSGCDRPIHFSNLKIRAKTGIEIGKERFTTIQNIFIKDGMVRVDVMGVFDDIITTILLKERKLYVIDYQQQILYTFANEEEIGRVFNISIPFSVLNELLTLSVDEKRLTEKDNNKFVYTENNEDKITFFIEPEYCSVKKAEILYSNGGKISAIYQDFSTLQGKRIYHRIQIQDEKRNMKTDIKIIKISFEEIDNKTFDISRFGAFKNVIK
ncbi:MAG: hypothetical protein ACP5KG_01315 [Myxococcota bacterium]